MIDRMPGEPVPAEGWEGRFGRPLPRDWYRRPTRRVARDLLGCWLVRRRPGAWDAGRIVETEAYVGGDPASHAFRGPTVRNRSMFGPPGTLYVYRIHQVCCANITTIPGEAVLLRAAEPLTPGLPVAVGPGRLCRAFHLARAEDGQDVVTARGIRITPGPKPFESLVRGPRVGVRAASELPLRFALQGNPWVSYPRPPGWRRGRRRRA